MKRRRPSAAFKVLGSGKQKRSSGWRSGSDAVNSTSSLGYSPEFPPQSLPAVDLCFKREEDPGD